MLDRERQPTRLTPLEWGMGPSQRKLEFRTPADNKTRPPSDAERGKIPYRDGNSRANT
jgi:hypothetical protein